MNIYENENSLNENLNNFYQINSKNISLFNLKFMHKIFNSINISLLILIFILSFLSFNSQRKWTSFYKNLAKTRSNNKIESLNSFKKTTPQDLIYLDKSINKPKKNKLIKNLKFIQDGLKDSKYQRGY